MLAIENRAYNSQVGLRRLDANPRRRVSPLLVRFQPPQLTPTERLLAERRHIQIFFVEKGNCPGL